MDSAATAQPVQLGLEAVASKAGVEMVLAQEDSSDERSQPTPRWFIGAQVALVFLMLPSLNPIAHAEGENECTRRATLLRQAIAKCERLIHHAHNECPITVDFEHRTVSLDQAKHLADDYESAASRVVWKQVPGYFEAPRAGAPQTCSTFLGDEISKTTIVHWCREREQPIALPVPGRGAASFNCICHWRPLYSVVERLCRLPVTEETVACGLRQTRSVTRQQTLYQREEILSNSHPTTPGLTTGSGCFCRPPEGGKEDTCY